MFSHIRRFIRQLFSPFSIDNVFPSNTNSPVVSTNQVPSTITLNGVTLNLDHCREQDSSDLQKIFQQRQGALWIPALLNAGWRIEEYAVDGKTLLHMAAEMGDTQAINALIQLNPKLNVNMCTRPLVSVFEIGWNEWDASVTPLHLAAKNNQAAAADLLMQQGADVTASTDALVPEDFMDFPMINFAQGYTPLHFAIKNNNLPLVQQMLESIAANATEVLQWQKIDTVNNRRESPLTLAIRGGHTQLVNYMVHQWQVPLKAEYLDLAPNPTFKRWLGVLTLQQRKTVRLAQPENYYHHHWLAKPFLPVLEKLGIRRTRDQKITAIDHGIQHLLQPAAHGLTVNDRHALKWGETGAIWNKIH